MNKTDRRCALLLSILIIGIVALTGCGSGAVDLPQTKAEVPRISPQEVQNRIGKGESILIVDARSANSYAQAHVAGAISVPLNEVASRLDELPRDREIVFYCT
jgi:predicted sulfurtransferase